MKKIKYIIIILIVSILINTYINISYGIDWDSEDAYSEMWDNNRDGKLDDEEREYAKQNIQIMRNDPDEKTLKSRYEGYEDVNSVQEKMWVTLEAGKTKLYLGRSNGKPEENNYCIKDSIQLNDFERYINSKVKTYFSDVWEWLPWNTEHQFYRIPIEEFLKSLNNEDSKEETEKQNIIQFIDLMNRYSTPGYAGPGTASSPSGYMPEEQHVKDVYIEVSDIATEIKDVKDENSGNYIWKQTLSKQNIDEINYLIKSEKLIFELKDLDDEAFISSLATFNEYENIVARIKELNSLRDKDISKEDKDKEEDIKKYGYSGWRVQKDKEDLQSIKNQIERILIFNRKVAYSENGQLKLKSIANAETGIYRR